MQELYLRPLQPGYWSCQGTGTSTLAKTAHNGDEFTRSAEKILAFLFQLPGWALMAPSWLAGEPGAGQNWLFSCWHGCMHRRQNL